MNPSQTPGSRHETLAATRETARVPVLIIGGGINGAGVFRELALQGVDCLLVERGDYGGGTSAAPSRLIHGGLKYLETGEFGLVAESARERNRLLRNAPHYVKPLESVVPVYARWAGLARAGLRFVRLSDRPVERGAGVLRLGLTLYDWLGRHSRSMPRHRYYSRRASLSRMPALRADIVGTGCYYDARVTHAERLVLELVLDGERVHEGGALALNYLEAAGHDGAGGVVLRDRETDETIVVAPELVINAAGPWIDQGNRRLGIDGRRIKGHKGSHLIVDHPELHAALGGRMVYFGASDGRICLAYPFFGRVLVGSTDIPVDDVDAAACEPDEIRYMLGEVQRLFPTLPIEAADVIYRYVGVRPLPATEGLGPGQVPRSHTLPIAEAGDGRAYPVLSMIGGKWTTFRSFAAETADVVLERLGRPRVADSVDRAIGGGRDYPDTRDAAERWVAACADDTGLAPADVRALLARYGTRARAVATAIADDGARRLTTLDDYFRAEIVFFADEEHARSVTDVLLRRTTLALTGRVDRAVLEEVGDILADALAWDSARRAREFEAAAAALQSHGVDFAAAPASAIERAGDKP